MRRRDFIAVASIAVSGAVASHPLRALAQQPGKPVIGVLGGTALKSFAAREAAFREGLKSAGYVEGDNLAVEAHWADGAYERLPGMAADLVARRVAVIVAFTTPAARAAQAATSTIPIVFTTISDPVQIGLVRALSHPGGNITGATVLGVEVDPKLLDLLHELLPQARSIALLVNPNNPSSATIVKSMESAAGTLGLALRVLKASNEREVAAAFAALPDQRVEGLVIPRDAFLETQSAQIAAMTMHSAIPTICQDRAFAVAGGLMSYTTDEPAMYREVGIYTGRILKGEQPADLPVMQPTKFDFVINLKAAKALAIAVPQRLVVGADEVIE